MDFVGSGCGFGEDAVEGPVDPLHDVETVEADDRLGHLRTGGADVGLADVHTDDLDLFEHRIGLSLIEISQRLLAAPGTDVDDGAGVVVADDRQVAVRVAVADLINPDPIQRVEPTLVK